MTLPLALILVALGIGAVFCFAVFVVLSIGDSRYERIQAQIDDEVIDFAASIPEGFDADGLPY